MLGTPQAPSLLRPYGFVVGMVRHYVLDRSSCDGRHSVFQYGQKAGAVSHSVSCPGFFTSLL